MNLLDQAKLRRGELHLSKRGEVLWRTFGNIYGQFLGVCGYYTSELSERWDRREDSRAVENRQSKG